MAGGEAAAGSLTRRGAALLTPERSIQGRNLSFCQAAGPKLLLHFAQQDTDF